MQSEKDAKMENPNVSLIRFFFSQLTKGQLISKGLFDVIVSTKNQRNFLWIPALASKKKLNQKLYYTKYVK